MSSPSAEKTELKEVDHADSRSIFADNGRGAVIKIDFDGDLRRVPLAPPIKMKGLQKLLTKSFPALPKDRTVVYFDEDGDAITIARDCELREALRHITQDMGLKTLRLHVSAAASAPAHAPSYPAMLAGAASDPAWRESKATEATPRAHFVADLAIPDGSVVRSRSSFRKVWSIKNPGPTAWPVGVRLVHVEGVDFGAAPHSVVYGAIGAGESVELALDLEAPGEPGQHVGFWRLCTPEGEPFGHRLWADVTVREEHHCRGGFARWMAGGAFGEHIHTHVHRGLREAALHIHGIGVHVGVQCDGCGEAPIIGTRYHKIGANYDLNASEFAKLPLGEQRFFERIERPGATPVAIRARVPELSQLGGDAMFEFITPPPAIGRFVSALMLAVTGEALAWPAAKCVMTSGEGPSAEFVRLLVECDAKGCAALPVEVRRALHVYAGDRTIHPDALAALSSSAVALAAWLWDFLRADPELGGIIDAARATPAAQAQWRPCGFAPLRQETRCLKAAFEGDVTVPDGTAIEPGARFIKTWNVRNSGAEAWPSGAKLVHVANEDLSVESGRGVDVVPLDAGSIAPLSVEMVAPDVSGRVRSTWRLQTVDGRYFGTKMWCEINVIGRAVVVPAAPTAVQAAATADAAAADPATEVAVSDDTTDAETTLLLKLAELGFAAQADGPQRDEILAIVRREGGDLRAVVNRLLSIA